MNIATNITDAQCLEMLRWMRGYDEDYKAVALRYDITELEAMICIARGNELKSRQRRAA